MKLQKRVLSAVLLTIMVSAGCQQANIDNGKPISRGIFDVHDFGAVGDGKTLDTAAVQAAINACSQAGGGKVYLSNGKFLSGTLYLKDNVTIYLETGAVLLGSTDINDYPVTVPEFRSYTDRYTDKSLIYAEKLKNIAIAGRGTIDGQGASFKGEWKVRPYILRVIECRDVVIKDVTMRDSAMWMQHYLACDNVRVDGITVYNHCNRNNDMIDIDGCRDVTIANCIADTDDDALTLKSTCGRPTENVTVTNCVLSSHCNAIKCGTESNGGFRNIAISNVVIKSSSDKVAIAGRRYGLAGIALEIVDGGIMENVAVSNIAIERVGTPIFLRLGNRARPYKKDMSKPGIGRLRNILISNVQARAADRIGCSISGLAGHPVENVTLENIRIRFEGGGTVEDARREIPEKPDAYPEHKMFGVLPAYGFYVRHAENVKLRNVELRFKDQDHRPALVCDDVEGLEIFNLDAESREETPALIWLKQVTGAFIHGCRPAGLAQSFVMLDGDKTRDISLTSNDLSKVKKVCEKGADVAEDAVHVLAH